MNKFRIDSNIPIPKIKENDYTSTLQSMNIGDSVDVGLNKNVVQQFHKAAKRLGMKVTSKTIYSDSKDKQYKDKSYRIWRIE